MVNEQTQKLAERIALLLQENEKGNDDFSFVHASLEKINDRLDKIESQISFENSTFKTQNPKFNHPSQDKFENLEELTNQIADSLQSEKACTFEPNGKPCDHCAMCNSRGF